MRIEYWTAIISAGISSFFIIVGIVLTHLFNYRYRKLDFEEKLFMESRQKKLAVYEDVIRELHAMSTPDIKKFVNITSIETSEIILGKMHILDGLLARLVIFGSSESRVPLIKLREYLFVVHAKSLDEPLSVDMGVEITGTFNDMIDTTRQVFSIVVSEETLPKFVYEKNKTSLKNTAREKLRKKPKGDSNDQNGDHK